MVQSPTGITNAIPRPLSPRRTISTTPSHSSQNTKNSLQKSVDNSIMEETTSTSAPRRRARGELGIFSKAAVACVSPQVLVNNKAAMCMDNSIEKGVEYTNQYVPVAKARVKKVADTVVPVVKEGAVDFAMTAAEAYRQECKSEEQNRGGDELFFQNPNATTIPEEPENSLLAGSSNRSHDGSLMSKGGVFDPWDNSNMGNKDSVFDVSEESEEVSDVLLNGSGGGVPFTKEKRTNNNLLYRNNRSASVDPNRNKAPVRQRFPDSNRTEHLTPPRVTRAQNKSPLFPSGSGGGKQELRATRMELFTKDQGKNDTTEARLSKALYDLDKQDTVIDQLKRQLESTQDDLDETHTKLNQARRQAQSSPARRALRGKHQDETALTDQLQETIAKLQLEISTLQLQAQEKDLSVMSGLPAYSASFDGASGTNKSQIIALRTEIVELRSQLAEAHASVIDDNASVRTFEELDDLRHKLKNTEAELRDFKKKEQNFQKLQEQMFLLQYEANETKITLEDKLQEASTVELELRAELSKTKASLQKLENEKSRKRLLDSSGANNRQLQMARDEIAKLKEELGQEKKNAKEQIDQLSKELEEVKQKLMTAEDEVVDVKTKAMNDRKKMEDGMKEQSETVKSLQSQLHTRDEKLIAHLRKISELEALLIDNGVDSSSHLKKIGALERKVVQLESSERMLKQELELQKNLLKEERAQKPAMRAGSVDKERLSGLKQRMERVKSFESPLPARKDVDLVIRETALKKQIEDLKAQVARLQKSQTSDGMKEEILLQEITSLKAKLRQTESLGKEEKLRSEEERRMSRDLSVGHSRELERLRQEQLETLEAKNKMEQEVIELRKKLLEATQSNVQTAKVQAKESEGTDVTGKVNRLRSELAIARQRLVTAREQSRAAEGESKDSTPQRRPVSWPRTPPSPVGSNFSQGSSWAPPGIARLHVVSSQPSTELQELTKEISPVQSPSNTVVTASTARSKSPVVPTSTTRSKSPAATKIVVAPTVRTTPTVVTPEKSDILPPPKPSTFSTSKSSVRSSNADLRQRLEASRRRLDNANSKLEKLLAPGNIVLVQQEEKNESLLEEVLGQ